MTNRNSSWARPIPVALLSLITATGLITAGCASGDLPMKEVAASETAVVSPTVITAIGLEGGTLYLSRSNGEKCILQVVDLAKEGTVQSLGETNRCPDRIEVLPWGEPVLRFPARVELIEPGTSNDLIAVSGDGSFVYSDGGTLYWRLQEEDVQVPGIEPGLVTIVEGAVVGVRKTPTGWQVVRFEPGGESGELEETVLIEAIGEVQWIAVDDESVEMALSAVRDGSTDIAIANLEEPVMNWIPHDPADEARPRFSPIGYKLSYIIRNPGGDIIRTVHVPTSAMVLVDFPWSVIRDYFWFPDGERLAIALSSPLASDHVVEATYTGSTQRMLVEPEMQFDRDVDRIPGAPPGSILILPSGLGYGDLRPLVIWARSGTRPGLEFDPDLVPLLERDDIGIIIVNGSLDRLSGVFHDSVAEAPWVDEAAIWATGEGDGDQLPENVHFVKSGSGLDAARRILQEIDQGARQR